MRKSASRLLVFALTFLMAWSVAVKPAQANVWDWIRAQFRSKEASENMQTSITQEGVSGEKHVTETTSNLMNVINLHVLGTTESESSESAMLQQSVGSGLIGTVNSSIVAMYDSPINSQVYLADLLQNAKIIPEAQAQGLGFASLDPILETWKQFRNIAYLFFVVIFLVIGFMIMFRAKIGQVAITVQQAIPNIIVALLAVTFSYAIAGFMIDIMYLLLYLLTSLFDGQQDLISGSIFTLVGSMFRSFGPDVRQAVTALMENLLGEGFVADALVLFSSLSASMIVGLAILFSVFKIFLELLKSYVSIILQVVFAPVILMVGAIPGQNTFVSWLKNLTGNLIMWPIILICLLVNRMLTSSTYYEGGSSGGFMPPYLLGSGQGAVFPVLVGIGILLIIPEIMKEVKKMLGLSEGIMGNLAGAAMKQLQEGWNKGGKFMVGAGVSAGTGALGGLAGAGVGFARAGEGASFQDRLKAAGEGAIKGGAFGVAAPTVIANVPKLVTGTINTGIQQAQQGLSTRATEAYATRKKAKEIAQASQRGGAAEEAIRDALSTSPEANEQVMPSSIPETAGGKEVADQVVGE